MSKPKNEVSAEEQVSSTPGSGASAPPWPFLRNQGWPFFDQGNKTTRQQVPICPRLSHEALVNAFKFAEVARLLSNCMLYHATFYVVGDTIALNAVGDVLAPLQTTSERLRVEDGPLANQRNFETVIVLLSAPLPDELARGLSRIHEDHPYAHYIAFGPQSAGNSLPFSMPFVELAPDADECFEQRPSFTGVLRHAMETLVSEAIRGVETSAVQLSSIDTVVASWLTLPDPSTRLEAFTLLKPRLRTKLSGWQRDIEQLLLSEEIAQHAIAAAKIGDEIRRHESIANRFAEKDRICLTISIDRVHDREGASEFSLRLVKAKETVTPYKSSLSDDLVQRLLASASEAGESPEAHVSRLLDRDAQERAVAAARGPAEHADLLITHVQLPVFTHTPGEYPEVHPDETPESTSTAEYQRVEPKSVHEVPVKFVFAGKAAPPSYPEEQ